MDLLLEKLMFISFGLSSKLKKKEPSFKEFLASPAVRFSFKELSL